MKRAIEKRRDGEERFEIEANETDVARFDYRLELSASPGSRRRGQRARPEPVCACSLCSGDVGDLDERGGLLMGYDTGI
jgi:hypothetical protein